MRPLTLWVLVVLAALVPIRARTQDGRVIRANTTTSGSVVVYRGNIDVYGTVRGNATALKGSVIVHRGGRITGNATAVGGRIIGDRSAIGGKVRTHYTRSSGQWKDHRRQAFGHGRLRSVGLAVSWLVVVALVGFALLALGADKLAIVINTMQRGVGKSLGSGLLGQLAIVPAAVGVVVLLAASLIGIFLIPLGLVAFIFFVAGTGMFGFVAAATMTGAAITGGRDRDATPQGAMLRAFVTGTSLYLGLWLVAALFHGVPLVGAMLVSFASAVTFVAATTGFGAVLLSWWRGEFKQGNRAAA